MCDASWDFVRQIQLRSLQKKCCFLSTFRTTIRVTNHIAAFGNAQSFGGYDRGRDAKRLERREDCQCDRIVHLRRAHVDTCDRLWWSCPSNDIRQRQCDRCNACAACDRTVGTLQTLAVARFPLSRCHRLVDVGAGEY